LISRFSEDIDVTVFRDDLGQSANVEQLEQLSGKMRRARLDAIKAACQIYITDRLQRQVADQLAEDLARAGLPPNLGRVETDSEDPDRQSLLVWYPRITPVDDGYVRPAIKIEAGAKSAIDPNVSVVVRPYVAGDVPGIDLAVPNVTTVAAERTFWDKVVILHGLWHWYDRRAALRGGQRVSRHYYDLYRLLDSDEGRQASRDLALAADCVRHARTFFGSPDLNLEAATPGSFSVRPTSAMAVVLERDYRSMTGMIFGEPPSFDQILDVVGQFEAAVNAL
jgi:hypothetical protein